MAIRARLAPLSMISSESRTISGLRRISTPNAPVKNRKALTHRYQTTSGPFKAASPDVRRIDRSFQTDVPPATPAKPARPPARPEVGVASATSLLKLRNRLLTGVVPED